MTKGYEIRAYAQAHGITDGEALKILTAKKINVTPQGDEVERNYITPAVAAPFTERRVAERRISDEGSYGRSLSGFRGRRPWRSGEDRRKAK